MRLANKQMSDNEVEELIKSTDHGVLSVTTSEGYPYGVPLNYGYIDGKFYFHSTSGESLKIDSINENPEVSLTIIGDYKTIAEDLTGKYASVIVFGKAKVITDTEEKKDAMLKMMSFIVPEMIEKVKSHCLDNSYAYSMIELTPENITGKKG